MEVQDDTIYVTGMPEGTTEEVVAEYFGQIGLIKVRAYTTAPLPRYRLKPVLFACA